MSGFQSGRGLDVLRRFDTPWKVQEYLNGLPYDHDDACVSPLVVLREGKAHCMEGALFAAACLRLSGREPLIVDLRAVNDDDHVIAVFREGNLWGAVSKSGFITLEFREPVYRSLRELVMSYFEFYLNEPGHLSLREYSRPLNLRLFDELEWMSSEGDLDYIGEALDKVRHYPILAKGQRPRKVDRRLFDATMHESKRCGGGSHKGKALA